MTYRILLLTLLTLLAYSPASAQMDNMFGGAQSDAGEEPPLQLPPVPTAPAIQQSPQVPSGNQVVEAYFPELPPSRLCKQKDVLGLWKVGMVYENPTGTELAEFSSSPFQYVLFNQDSTFTMYKGSKAETSETDVYKRLKNRQEGVLQQYVVHESGIVYFYKDGIAYDSYACFIVANKLDPFSVGQMLFMPPPDKATVRMVKAYNKVFGAAKAAPKKSNKANKSNKAKNKKNKNRR